MKLLWSMHDVGGKRLGLLHRAVIQPIMDIQCTEFGLVLPPIDQWTEVNVSVSVTVTVFRRQVFKGSYYTTKCV